MSYKNQLREIANQNRGKPIAEARRQTELQAQEDQAKLRKSQTVADRERRRLESKRAEIKRKIDEAAEAGHYEVAVDYGDVHFDFIQWYNPFHILTGHIHLLEPKTSARDRELLESFTLSQSLGFRPRLRLLRQRESGVKRWGSVALIVEW
jgi:hypothetical protein